jgi:hypothetical protein
MKTLRRTLWSFSDSVQWLWNEYSEWVGLGFWLMAGFLAAILVWFTFDATAAHFR